MVGRRPLQFTSDCALNNDTKPKMAPEAASLVDECA